MTDPLHPLHNQVAYLASQHHASDYNRLKFGANGSFFSTTPLTPTRNFAHAKPPLPSSFSLPAFPFRSRCTGTLCASEHTATKSCEGHANVPGDDRREAALVVGRSPVHPPPPPPPHPRGQKRRHPRPRRRVPGHLCPGEPLTARAGPQQRHRIAYPPASPYLPSRCVK